MADGVSEPAIKVDTALVSQVVPGQPKGQFEKIGYSVEFGTAVIVLFLNVVISYAILRSERRLFKKRLREDRGFQSGTYFYQNLVIGRLHDFVNAVRCAEQIYRTLLEAIEADPTNERQFVEDAVDELDAVDTGFRDKTLALVALFSPPLRAALYSDWEIFYDSCTELCSRGRPSGATTTSKLLRKLAVARTTYIDSVVARVKGHHPST